jgi:hypothetical protein
MRSSSERWMDDWIDDWFIHWLSGRLVYVCWMVGRAMSESKTDCMLSLMVDRQTNGRIHSSIDALIG